MAGYDQAGVQSRAMEINTEINVDETLYPTCPICGFQHEVRTVIVMHMMKAHNIIITTARENLTFRKKESKGE